MQTIPGYLSFEDIVNKCCDNSGPNVDPCITDISGDLIHHLIYDHFSQFVFDFCRNDAKSVDILSKPYDISFLIKIL